MVTGLHAKIVGSAWEELTALALDPPREDDFVR